MLTDRCHIALLKSFFPFLFFFLLLAAGYSQSEGFVVKGTIWDEESGAPIENANISILNTKGGSISNAMGEFKLSVKSLPFYLEISHVAYETKILEFEHKPMHELQVYLQQKSEPLSEVTITGQQIDTLYADRVYSVLDYELTDRGILLLVFKARLSRAELLLQDYAGNKLLELPVLPMKPLALYKDCLNEIHILSKDQSFQILMEEDRIRLYTPYSLQVFKEVLLGCKFKIGEKVYFEKFEFYDLIKKYYYVNALDTTSHLLTVVRDEEKINFISQNPENYALGNTENESAWLSNLRGLPSDSNVLEAIRNMTTELRFNKMAYLSKIYAPAYALDDTIAIFNHPENTIEFYDTTDALIGKTGIDYHLGNADQKQSSLVYAFAKSSKWLQEIYVDDLKNKAYTLYQAINGTRQLNEIDLETGETAYRLTIPFPYVQKIKIRDDKVYFIYKGFGTGQNKKLFRQRIN